MKPPSKRMSTASQAFQSVDYLAWFNRVIGWDAALPLFVSTGSVLIAKALKHQPPADILAMAGLPAIAFLVRYAAGRRQIFGNACGALTRRFQFSALVLALFVVAFVDFFIALIAFVPKANAPKADVMMPFYVITLFTYVTLVTFAMYPGRYLARTFE